MLRSRGALARSGVLAALEAAPPLVKTDLHGIPAAVDAVVWLGVPLSRLPHVRQLTLRERVGWSDLSSGDGKLTWRSARVFAWGAAGRGGLHIRRPRAGPAPADSPALSIAQPDPGSTADGVASRRVIA